MSSSRRIATALAVLATTVALVPATSAQAASPVPKTMAPATSSMASVSKVKVTFATKADLAVDASTTAQPGEGVIRITTRICGNANNWQAVAAANSIMPPTYLVLLGQKLTVACTGSPAPAAAPEAPASAAAPASSGWVVPVDACITSGYGPRWGTFHWGVDLGAGMGAPIHAVTSGTVVSSGWIYDGYGIDTLIQNDAGYWSHYAHQSRTIVSAGQHIEAGEVIGFVGSTGQSTGPHLHFEIWTRGSWGSGNPQINPVQFLADRGVTLGC